MQFITLAHLFTAAVLTTLLVLDFARPLPDNIPYTYTV